MDNINISIIKNDNCVKAVNIDFGSHDSAGKNKEILLTQNLEVKVKMIHPSAVIPKYAKKGDAGFDLVAVAGASLAPGQRSSLPIGLAFEIPDGCVGLVWDRSGLSHKKGLKTLGGVIDSSYRGEVMVGLLNTSDESVEIMKGDKIAQMLIQKIESVDFKISDELSATERGESWAGSTDTKPIEKIEENFKVKEKEHDGKPKSSSRW